VTTPTLHRPVLGGTRGTTRPGNAPLRGAEEADSSADPVAVPGAGHVGVLDVSSAPPPERRRAGCRRGRAATPGEGGADPQAAGHLHPQSAAPCWDGGLELSPCPRRQSTHPAGSTSTLAGPNFGPKNGVHLSRRQDESLLDEEDLALADAGLLGALLLCEPAQQPFSAKGVKLNQRPPYRER